MLLYRFRIWVDDDGILMDDDVYQHEIPDESLENFHHPGQVYQALVPPDEAGGPFMHCILSDTKELIIEYVRGFALATEIIPSKIPLGTKVNPFRTAVPQTNAEVAK